MVDMKCSIDGKYTSIKLYEHKKLCSGKLAKREYTEVQIGDIFERQLRKLCTGFALVIFRLIKQRKSDCMRETMTGENQVFIPCWFPEHKTMKDFVYLADY